MINTCVRITNNEWNKKISSPISFCTNTIEVGWKNLQKEIKQKKEFSSLIDNKIEVSILLSDDKNIRQLNNIHLGNDKPTNVLAFPAHVDTIASGSEILIGDIALSIDSITKEADEQKINILNHTSHLLIHGLLHLLGYDHKNEKEAEIMENLEIESLEKLGIPDPYYYNN